MGGRRCGYLCHSAKGATHDIICGIQSLDISIHAPVKGATPARHSVCRRISNFNPRSREGSDSAVLDQLGGDRHFNPRSREGSDRKVVSVVQTVRISIHAPVKGATAKITKTIPNDFCKINNYNNSFA